MSLLPRHDKLFLLKLATPGYETNKLLTEITAINCIITDVYVTPDPGFPSGL